MRLGLVVFDADEAVREARLAEQLGFDYVAAGEHVFFHGSVLNPFVALAAAAGATERIRLLSAISLLPLYAPALAAKLVTTLDRVSGGRLELGVGAGGEYPPEFEACGVPLESRFRRLDECLRIFARFAAGMPVVDDGEYGRLDGLTLDPPPLQQPWPPIWVGGREAGARRRAARFADVWMPYMVTPEAFSRGLAEVRAAAAGHGRNPVGGAIFTTVCVDADGDWARSTGIAFVSGLYRQDFSALADRYLAVGTPAQVAARLREYADAGAETAVVAIAAPAAQRERVIRTFASDVAPELGPYPPHLT